MALADAYVMPHPPIIIPEVGRGEHNKLNLTTEAFGRAARQIAGIAPETIIVVSPHAPMYSDYFHISPGEVAEGNFGDFRAPEVVISKNYDEEFVSELTALAQDSQFPAGTLGQEGEGRLDHGTMIPLYFIDKMYTDYKLVRIGISGLSLMQHYELGKMIARTAEKLDRKTVMIASGDLSHKLKEEGPYGFTEEGPAFDEQVKEILFTANFIKLLEFKPAFLEAAAECGLRSFVVMAGALDQKSVVTESLSYQSTFGVGYALYSFHVTGNNPSRDFGDAYIRQRALAVSKARKDEDPYVVLARASLEVYVKTGETLVSPENLPKPMKKQAGVFVSIKKDGQLRGCIGTIMPTQPDIAREIMHNAVSAGTQDPRFPPVTEDELDQLTYSVDILGPPQDVSSIDQLDPKEYGVIVSHGWRRGLLLPNLEGVDTVQQQVSIALQKAEIDPDEGYNVQRFFVVRHE